MEIPVDVRKEAIMQIDIQRRFSLLTPAALLTNVRLQTGLLLWALLVFAPAAGAQATCQGGVVSVPVLSPFSVSAAVGDYTLTCGGGASISPLPTMEFLASFAVEVVNTGPPTVTDGVNNYIGVVASNQVQFSAVPFNPVAMNFEFENIFVDANELAPGSQFFESMS